MSDFDNMLSKKVIELHATGRISTESPLIYSWQGSEKGGAGG